MKRLFCFLLAVCLLFPMTVSVPADGASQIPRPSVNGRLHVEGTRLVDASGKEVQLRGVSTHGLTWFPEFINENLFRQVSEDWNGSLVRLAMYASVYEGEEREESYALMRKGIEAARAAEWFTYLNEHGVSYAVWSLSDKDESSAIFRPGFDPEETILDTDLTICGRWVRELIRGNDPKTIPVPAPIVEKAGWII